VDGYPKQRARRKSDGVLHPPRLPRRLAGALPGRAVANRKQSFLHHAGRADRGEMARGASEMDAERLAVQVGRAGEVDVIPPLLRRADQARRPTSCADLRLTQRRL